MEMVILLHKQDIGSRQHKHDSDQVNPMRQNRVGNRIDKYQRNHKLEGHIQRRNLYMSDLQLIGHQLVCMLAMSLSEILMKQDPVDDCKTCIDAINNKEHQICDVPGLEDDCSKNEKNNESDADRTHISGKAFRFSLRPEIEDTEHQHAQYRHNDQRRIHEKPLCHSKLYTCHSERSRGTPSIIHQHHRHQHSQRIPRSNAIDAIHEIIHIRDAHINDQRQHNHPPHIPMQNIHLVKRHRCSGELHHKPHRIRQAPDIINETDTRHKRQSRQKPRIIESIKSRIQPRPKKKNDTSSAKCQCLVRAPLIRLVNNVEPVRDLEVHQLQKQE